MKSNKYIWFSLCLTYVQFHILHPKLYTFGFYSESKCISGNEESERTNIPSLTDLCSCQTEELVPLGAPWGMADEPRWFQADPLSHSLSVSTLEPGCGWYRADTQNPTTCSHLQDTGSNFYLRACQGGLSQPAFGKEEHNFPPLSLSVRGQPLFYECTPGFGFVNLYKKKDSGSQNKHPP